MTCERDNCDNTATAHPCLVFRVHRCGSGARLEYPGLPTCTECQETVKVREFLDDGGWERFLKVFDDNHLKRPKKWLTTLEWVPIQ